MPLTTAELRTVLSATIMLADSPHRLNVFRASNLAHAQMIMLMEVGVKGDFDPAQARDPAQLGADQCHQMIPAFEQQRQAEGRKKPGKPAALSDEPNPKAQRNFTDPDSRIMKSKEAYNAQAAVDAGAQIIVAHELTQCGNDQRQLVPLIEAIENNLGRKPEQVSAATAAKPTSKRSKHTVLTAMSLPDAPSTRQQQTEKSADR
jgi:hypothetical protein